MKKRICILGTSPLMIIIYYRLFKKNIVDIFDNKKMLGGAWSYNKQCDVRYSNFNNIILPANQEEDNNILKINSELKKNKCIIHLPSVPLKIKDSYKPKNIYIHNFSEFFKNFERKNLVLKKKIRNIEINLNEIVIDNKKYDFLFLPSCFKVKNLSIKNKKYPLDIKIVNSKHVSIFFGDNRLNLCTYDDDFDNIFDRAQIRKIDHEYIFTGRVRKNFKSKDIRYLINNSYFLSKLKHLIKNYKINFFEHNIIDEKDLLNIKKITSKLPVSIVETRQFSYGYLRLEESLYKLNMVS